MNTLSVRRSAVKSHPQLALIKLINSFSMSMPLEVGLVTYNASQKVKNKTH